jgi:hypothetical protein
MVYKDNKLSFYGFDFVTVQYYINRFVEGKWSAKDVF